MIQMHSNDSQRAAYPVSIELATLLENQDQDDEYNVSEKLMILKNSDDSVYLGISTVNTE